MRKTIFRLFLVLAVIFPLAALCLLFWLQGNGFRNWISKRLDQELVKYNLCLTGDLEVNPLNFQAEVHKLKIQTCESKETIFTAQRVFLKIKVISFFSKKFQLQDLVVDEPEIFVKFDSEGKSNFSQIRPPNNQQQENSFISSLTTTIRGGAIIYQDERVSFGGELKNFTLNALINKDSGHQINLITENSSLKYQDKELNLTKLNLQTKILSDRAEIQALKLATNLFSSTITGNVSNWQSLKYNLQVSADLDLQKTSKFVSSLPDITGQALLQAVVEGEKLDYRFQGKIQVPKFTAPDITAQDLEITGDFANSAFSGEIKLAQLQHKEILVKAFQSQDLEATKDQIEIKNFSLTTLGGNVNGNILLALNNSNSELKAKLNNLDVVSISKLIAKNNLTIPLTGKLNASVDLSWLETNINSLSGELTANFDTLTKDNLKIPLTGNLVAKLNKNNVLLEKAIINNDATNINTSGNISLINKNIDLVTKFETTNIQQTNELVSLFGLSFLPKDNNQISLSGKVTFDGKLTGLANSPNIQGDVFVEEILSANEEIGQFQGSINYQTKELSINQGILRQKSGGQAMVNLSTSLVADSNTLAKLKFQKFLISQNAIKAARNQALKSGSSASIYVLSALKNLAGEINGEVSLTGLPSFGDLAAKKAIDLNKFLGNLDLTIKNSHPNASFRNLAVKFAVENQSINFSRINLDLPSGTISGLASYHIPSKNYKVDLNSQNLNLLSFSKSLEQQSTPLSGIVAVNISGQGNINNPIFDLSLKSKEIFLGNQPLKNLSLTSQAKEGIANLKLTTNYQNRPYQMNGKVTLSDDLPLEAQIDLKNDSLLPLLALFTTVPPRLETIATGALKIAGPLSTDEGLSLSKIKVLVDVSNLAVQVKTSGDEENVYEVVNEGPILLEAGLNRLVFTKFNLKGDKTNFSVSGRVGGGNNTLKLSGELNLRLLNTISKSLFINGTASFNAAITNGTNLTGSASLKNIAVRYIDSPITLQDGAGQILFSNERALLDNFTAKANGGQVKVNGGLLFDKLRPSRLRLNVSAAGVAIKYPETVRSIVDTELLLQGSDSVQLLSGRINIRHSEYREDVDLAKLIASNFVFSIGDLTSFSFGDSLNLNLNVNAQDSIFVDNNVAEMVGSGALKVTGTLNNPIISGRATITRGTLFLRSDRYNITRGIVDFPNSRNGQLRFDIEADTNIRSYQIILNLAGTLNRFNTLIRSEPALPQPDIISLITTGQLLPPGTSAQALDSQTRLSPAIGLLSETLSQKVEQRTDKLFGLNRFQIDPLIAGRGSNPTARITLGRRITKNLSLTYSTNITTGQEQIVVVEYQVNRNVSIIGTREQDGTYGFDVRFRKKF
ncbi:MAG: translocation/assembly module TamB domain-containing protein [Blastocatellia bacterium]|nr:translocation/assembly module TamB domain-containing protein [Blastocatellia bacterium]